MAEESASDQTNVITTDKSPGNIDILLKDL